MILYQCLNLKLVKKGKQALLKEREEVFNFQFFQLFIVDITPFFYYQLKRVSLQMNQLNGLMFKELKKEENMMMIHMMTILI